MQLLTDQTFAYGFTLTGYDSRFVEQRNIGTLDYNGAASGKPCWRIGQWGCKHNLSCSRGGYRNGSYHYLDGSKELAVNPVSGAFSLNIEASKEYDAPRENGQPWPHYILEIPEITSDVKLASMQSLTFHTKFTLQQLACKMAAPDPLLHTALLLWYITVADTDPRSPGYRDYMWFGVNYVDARYDFPAEYAAQDGGKEDCTNNFIYNPAGREIFTEPVVCGKPFESRCNVLPVIEKAFHVAKKNGFLKNTDFSALAVTSTYFGWELPGTYDVAVDVEKLSLEADVG